ncbi:cold-inducible protein YdjO-related protein [Paenibacillus sp. MBLB4367]|uniref:cold-inducible protein YdjO-related protein n=1 Tax=Paenibacillus sp. MBLB4367 TaxID=3384767 RepID=UPI0039080E92
MHIRPSDETQTQGEQASGKVETKETAVQPDKPELKHSVVWKCKDKACKAWVREEFAESEYPPCPLCKGPTIRSFKFLPDMPKKKTRKPKAGGSKK